MRKTIYALALMATAMMPSMASADNGNVRFKGDVKGLKDSLIVMYATQGGTQAKDTVAVKDGKFDFTVSVAGPTNLYAYTPATLRHEERVGFQAVAVPGETAELSGDLTKSYYFSGSKFYNEFNEADRAMEAAFKPLNDFVSGLNSRMQAGEPREALMNEYQAKAPALKKQMLDGIMAFIKEHPNYEACAAIIPRLEQLDDMKEAVKLLSPSVRDGRMKPIYQSVISEMEKQAEAEAEAAKKQAAGVTAPDFTLNDINGKPLALSSLRGKYVVLDFWGSWCGWCIKGFPEMKKYYEKYKGKFEILGVDCNDREEKWRKAVKDHALPWLHVYNTRDSKLLEKYGVRGFPTKILVGPDGKIVKTYVGEDPAFYTFLDDTFGK